MRPAWERIEALLAGLSSVMRELEAVWKIARADLVIPTGNGGNDIFLWEHSLRVAKCAFYIAHIPQAQALQPDLLALIVAGLYHESGWITRFRSGEIDRFEVLLGTPAETNHVESVRIMQASLDSVVPRPSLQKATDAIRWRGAHEGDSVEGRILAEADNLEEFGLGFLWTAIRRGICGGKGVQAVIEAWQRRAEYHFWTARIRDSFLFEPSRVLAQSRLKHMETIMSQMNLQHHVDDVRAALESLAKVPVSPVSWPKEQEIRGSRGGG